MDRFAHAMSLVLRPPVQLLARFLGADTEPSERYWILLPVTVSAALLLPGATQMRTLLHWTGERPGDGAGNARPAGVADRYSLLAGDAFEVEYGTDFDLVLLTNSLHVLDAAAIERLLTRVYVALKAGGRVLIVEFIPNQAPWLETHQPKRRVARSARRLLRAIPKSRTGTAPDLAGTLVGKVDRARLITPTRARPGDRLLLTKGAPIEATAIFAREFAERLASVWVRLSFARRKRFCRSREIAFYAMPRLRCTPAR